MVLNVWNSLRGYVVIEVSGFSVERFINLATHRGVYIWDVCFEDGAAQMKVSAKAFRLLRYCAKKTKCKIKIKSKNKVDKSSRKRVIMRYVLSAVAAVAERKSIG